MRAAGAPVSLSLSLSLSPPVKAFARIKIRILIRPGSRRGAGSPLKAGRQAGRRCCKCRSVRSVNKSGHYFAVEMRHACMHI